MTPPARESAAADRMADAAPRGHGTRWAGRLARVALGAAVLALLVVGSVRHDHLAPCPADDYRDGSRCAYLGSWDVDGVGADTPWDVHVPPAVPIPAGTT